MNTPSNSLVVAALLLGACGKEPTKQVSLPAATGTTAVAAAPVRVETLTAAFAEVAAPVHATGTSQPIRKADLAAAMSARIEKIYVREGQRVTAGQLLLALDGRTAQLGAEQARAAAAASEAQAAQLDADYQRLQPLAERGSIATSRLEQLESQRKAARAQASAAKIAADSARKAATNAVVRAPFAGTIVDLPHEVGEMAMTTSPVARLIDVSRLEIHVRVPARDLGRIAPGDVVTATFSQLGVSAQGTISLIGLEVDPTTSTAEAVAVIRNDDGALRGGLFAELQITPSSKRKALLVPRTAVAGAGEGASVFAVVGGKATRRPVKTVPFDQQTVEIVSGLEDQTTLVSGQLDRISEGRAVSTAPASAASPASAAPASAAGNPPASAAGNPPAGDRSAKTAEVK